MPEDVHFRIAAAKDDLHLHSRLRTHWTIQVELSFACALDAGLVEQAAKLLLIAEPILACRLVLDADPPSWETAPNAASRAFETAKTYEEFETLRFRELDPAIGPQFSICLFQDTSGARLRAKIAHEVTDAQGAVGALLNFAFIYTRLAQNADYLPEANSDYDREGEKILASVQGREYARMTWESLRYYLPRLFPIASRTLVLPHEPGSAPAHVLRRLSEDQVASLKAYAAERSTGLNEVILAAIGRGLARVVPRTRNDAVRVAQTVSLRRKRSSLGNLSSAEFLTLGKNAGADFDETLARVRAFSQARLRRQPGLMLYWLKNRLQRRQTLDRIVRKENKYLASVIRKGRSPVLANLGRLNKARLSFAGQSPVSAYFIPASGNPLLLIGASEYNECLTLAVGTTEAARPTVEAFLDAVIYELPLEAGDGSYAGLLDGNGAA